MLFIVDILLLLTKGVLQRHNVALYSENILQVNISLSIFFKLIRYHSTILLSYVDMLIF